MKILSLINNHVAPNPRDVQSELKEKKRKWSRYKRKHSTLNSQLSHGDGWRTTELVKFILIENRV